MSNRAVTFCVLQILFLLIICVPAPAMPPSPDLMRRIRNHEIEEPYYLRNYREITASGVDRPEAIRTIDVLRQWSLDTDLRIIVILVDFNDHGSQTQASYFDHLLFDQEQGTLRDYYSQVSYGNLNLVTVNMPSALGWMRAPQTYSYYVNGVNGFGNYPRNAQRLTEDAIDLVDPVVDFSQYDNDGDGNVDALFVIHAGRGAEQSGNDNDIWSHMWSMSSPQQVDGVTARVYSMEPEYWSAPGDMTCGVYAHEMGHSVFFLPDLYDYGYDSEGIGRWSLMAGGSWNGQQGNLPAHPDAWSRIRMGFASATNVEQNLPFQSIPNVEGTPTIYRLWTDGQANNQYFLVENRQQTGYDGAIPGNGLLVYHIDESAPNNDNQWYPGHTNDGHFRVAVEQSDGEWAMEHNASGGDQSDPFPGIENHRVFNSNTVPDSRDYNGNDTHVALRHISASADTMVASLYVQSENGNQVFVYVPDSVCTVGMEVSIPVRAENDVTGMGITSVSFSLHFDSSLVESVVPFYNFEAMIPQGWSATVTHPTTGTVAVNASGPTPLSGNGPLISVRLQAVRNAQNESMLQMKFTSFVFNAGTPSADTANGMLRIVSPILSLNSPLLNFSGVRPQEEALHGLVIRNSGGADLILDSLVVSEPFSTDYSGSHTVGAGEWHGVRVMFRPTALQTYTDTIRIYSNAQVNPTVLAVTGMGALPMIAVSTVNLSFDSTTAGGVVNRTITVEDTGYTELHIQSMTFVSGAVFHLNSAPAWPATIQERSSRDFSIRFTPSGLGSFSDTLIITHDAGDPVRVFVHGECIVSGLQEVTSGIPDEFFLAQNYPNPFNPTTVFEFGLPHAAQTTISVYDVTGRHVAQLFNEALAAGRYSITWDAKGLGSGLYFIAMTGENLHLVRKATLLR